MNVLFLPANIQITIEQNTSLLDAIHQAGLRIDSPCGGYGRCGKCRVIVTKGNNHMYSKEEERFLSLEERNSGVRLACAMVLEEDSCVLLPQYFSHVNKTISKTVSNQEKELLLAIDIGTTTVEYIVLGAKDGLAVVKHQFYNPQRRFGADVIARVSLCQKDPSKVKVLQMELIEELTCSLEELLGQIGLSTKNISRAVVVANTTMCHLLTGRNPIKLASAPFWPDYMGGSVELAKELGLTLKEEATVEVLPFIGGHIGADTVGCLAAIELEKKRGCHLLVDIGTNGEIVLKGKEKLYACSTAAGPCFEGGSMSYGMCATTGAINKVLYEKGQIKLSVKGNVRPIGLSGTGILDAVAVLLKAGMIDHTGYLKDEYCEIDPNTRKEGYCLYRDKEGGIYITREDIRQLQLAKAAIIAGIQVLLSVEELAIEELSGIWIAGAFGTHLNLEHAMLLGLLPTIEITKYHQIGNAALTGAIKRLKQEVLKDELVELAHSVTHVELSEDELFRQEFINGMDFKQSL